MILTPGFELFAGEHVHIAASLPNVMKLTIKTTPGGNGMWTGRMDASSRVVFVAQRAEALPSSAQRL